MNKSLIAVNQVELKSKRVRFSPDSLVNLTANGKRILTTNDTVDSGVACYFKQTQPPNDNVPLGNAFTFDQQTINTMPDNLTTQTLHGGTVFTVQRAGVYHVEYGMALVGAGSIAMYAGSDPNVLNLVEPSIAFSNVGGTWIEGGIAGMDTPGPISFMISPVGVGAVVTSSAGDPTNFITRIVIKKIS
jgi:hypothetical protein